MGIYFFELDFKCNITKFFLIKEALLNIPYHSKFIFLVNGASLQ